MTVDPLPRRTLSALACLLFSAACSSPTAPPPVQPPSTPDAPAIACPTAVNAGVEQSPAVVTYPSPVVSAGAPPLVTSCTIESGASFPAGTTDVICTATDSLARRAQCAFQVRVSVTARLGATSFLAFGDSITEGEVSPPAPGPSVRVVEPANSYPTVLHNLLRDRYPTQATDFVVTNAGMSGRTAVADEDRFVEEVARRAPQVVLLLHGTNDVNGGTFPGAIGSSLRSDIRRALQRGVKVVLLSTLLPQVPGRFRAFNPQGIIETNFVIRDVAAREGAVLVDTFAALDPLKERLIGEDGLHPTVEGYRLMAATFFAAIRSALPASAPNAPAALLARPGRR